MTNSSPGADALTVTFPRLLGEIPEAQRLYRLITFDAMPGANEITTQFIIDGEVSDESDEAITEVIEIEQDKGEQDKDDEPAIDFSNEIAADFALDEPIPGDETITQFIDAPPSIALLLPSEAPRGHRGRRRAQSEFPYAMALLALAGIACLAYGVVVQVSQLAVTAPLLAAVSLPALVFSGVCLTLAILQKR